MPNEKRKNENHHADTKPEIKKSQFDLIKMRNYSKKLFAFIEYSSIKLAWQNWKLKIFVTEFFIILGKYEKWNRFFSYSLLNIKADSFFFFLMKKKH